MTDIDNIRILYAYKSIGKHLKFMICLFNLAIGGIDFRICIDFQNTAAFFNVQNIFQRNMIGIAIAFERKAFVVI